MNIIEIKNLQKSFRVLKRREGLRGSVKDLFSRNYSEVKAVNGISVEIKKGQIVGYLGPNGAGKSTTIKMMTGILEPSSGEIMINNLNPSKNRKKHAKNIGVVFGQRSQLWWALPVVESFKILKDIYKVDNEDFEEMMETFDNLVGIKSLYNKPVRQMSLGQRTLCDILASFLHNPEIVFLDEPTIGLDISVKEKIRTLIKELNKKYNTTIILTTHDISDVDALCERVVIIDNGKVIFDDNIEKLNKKFGEYRTLKINLKSSHEKFEEDIKFKFSNKNLQITNLSNGWSEVLIRQDELSLLELLNYIMKNWNIQDIRVEEVTTENIIRKIYQGEI